MQDAEELISLSDPGEIGKQTHNRGDRFVVWLSNIAAWFFPFLMLAICAQVVMRNMGVNQAWLDDFQWWIYGAAVLVGIAYAVTTNSHVRVDILYDRFAEDKKARTEVFALAWLFLPFVILAFDVTLPYALASIASDEGSDSPNGLHNLWILKSFMCASFLLIAVACWSAYLRNLSKLVEPRLWRQLLWAFPSTMFMVNLAVYYGIFGYLRLVSPPEMSNRDIGRLPIFDEFALGSYDIKYTIVITLVATLLLIGAARLLDRSQKPQG